MGYYDEDEFYELQKEVIELKENQKNLTAQLLKVNLALAKIYEIVDEYYDWGSMSSLFEMPTYSVDAIGEILKEYESC